MKGTRKNEVPIKFLLLFPLFLSSSFCPLSFSVSPLTGASTRLQPEKNLVQKLLHNEDLCKIYTEGKGKGTGKVVPVL
jgi:hypothetical protein